MTVLKSPASQNPDSKIKEVEGTLDPEGQATQRAAPEKGGMPPEEEARQSQAGAPAEARISVVQEAAAGQRQEQEGSMLFGIPREREGEVELNQGDGAEEVGDNCAAKEAGLGSSVNEAKGKASEYMPTSSELCKHVKEEPVEEEIGNLKVCSVDGPVSMDDSPKTAANDQGREAKEMSNTCPTRRAKLAAPWKRENRWIVESQSVQEAQEVKQEPVDEEVASAAGVAVGGAQAGVPEDEALRTSDHVGESRNRTPSQSGYDTPIIVERDKRERESHVHFRRVKQKEAREEREKRKTEKEERMRREAEEKEEVERRAKKKEARQRRDEEK
ncbi:hypothetical protein CBR_g23583 [Chara braunii]|uniref:Uncharacterized protein n=1 Tax=Chara braunii TaxID=69332 RepID=A0A388L4M2_CHABU|nr:hypothetical protein CBR_g23583 [Chara braunii]|eukprot:GBG77255.1 hypothetical protein CBR_g23583 [Chara braunii]